MRIIIICALAAILGVPAQAFDGTPLPPNTVPTFQPAPLPLDLPPDLLAQAPNPAFGQGVDPLIGSWKFNPEKSTSIGLPLPKSSILTFAREGENLTNTAEGVTAQGQPSKIALRHIYDGQPHPTTGSPTFDSTAYTRIGNSINAVRFRNEKAVELGQVQIVPGKTYTIIEEGIDVNGQPYRYFRVYDRQ